MNLWRSRFERWFTPLARRCPLSPNAISFAALLLNLAAAACLASRLFAIAIVVLSFGGLADAFDGVVARVQGKTSRYGDFLDHFFDRLSDLALIAGWMLGNRIRVEIIIAVLIVVMLNGYIGTQIEATWHERDYDTVGRGEFLLGLVIYPLVSQILFANHWDTLRPAAGLLIAEWMLLLLLLFSLFGIYQRFRLAARLAREGRHAA
jgi:archaetidylinositol phosphate synthase